MLKEKGNQWLGSASPTPISSCMPYSNYKADPFHFIKTAHGSHFDNFNPPADSAMVSERKPVDFFRYLREDEKMHVPEETPDLKKDIDFSDIDQFLSKPEAVLKHNRPNYEKVYDFLSSNAKGLDKDNINPNVCEIADKVNTFRQKQLNQLRCLYDIPIINTQNELEYILDVEALAKKTNDDYIANASMDRQDSVCLSEDDAYVGKMEDMHARNEAHYHLRTQRVHGKEDRPTFMTPN
jgi:hypothetical protein